MAEHTEIEWADSTFNPVIGCTEVSVGEKGACTGCYARELAKRYGWAEWGNHPRQRTSEANWRKPLAWNRKAAASGKPWFVFGGSLCDPFDNQWDPEVRRDYFDLIRATPHLIWLLLTKRPQNIGRLFADLPTLVCRGETLADRWPRNAAIGCTVVTQAEADRDIPHLLAAKAALNPAFAFVSMEPLMEAVDLTRLRGTYGQHEWMNALLGTGEDWPGSSGFGGRAAFGGRPRLDWVIAGGETDQGKFRARPSHPDWFRQLRDQCAAAGAPFLFKQHGEWVGVEDVRRLPSGQGPGFGSYDHCAFDMETDSVRVGKKAAGRRLDGVEHNARPEVRPHD